MTTNQTIRAMGRELRAHRHMAATVAGFHAVFVLIIAATLGFTAASWFSFIATGALVGVPDFIDCRNRGRRTAERTPASDLQLRRVPRVPTSARVTFALSVGCLISAFLVGSALLGLALAVVAIVLAVVTALTLLAKKAAR